MASPAGVLATGQRRAAPAPRRCRPRPARAAAWRPREPPGKLLKRSLRDTTGPAMPAVLPAVGTAGRLLSRPPRRPTDPMGGFGQAQAAAPWEPGHGGRAGPMGTVRAK